MSREHSTPIAVAQATDVAHHEETSTPPQLPALYEAWATAVAQRLFRLCGNRETARDLTQDTFVVAMRQLDRLRDANAVGPWLHGIAYNLLRDHRRSHARRRGLWQRWFARSAPTTPAPADDEPALVRTLDQALRGLDNEKRDAFVLRQLEGLSLAEAAELLDVSVQTVSYRAKQAEAHLRAAFAPDDSPAAD